MDVSQIQNEAKFNEVVQKERDELEAKYQKKVEEITALNPLLASKQIIKQSPHIKFSHHKIKHHHDRKSRHDVDKEFMDSMRSAR